MICFTEVSRWIRQKIITEQEYRRISAINMEGTIIQADMPKERQHHKKDVTCGY